jgi:hypothetical protein
MECDQTNKMWNQKSEAEEQEVSLGGLDLSRRGHDRDSQSQHWKKVRIDGRDNLDNFKKLVSTIEKSRSRSCLNSKDNLDKFQKLISTDREISISIGLDRSRNLDLDWSQLSRPPGLTRSHNIKTAFGLARDFALRSPLAVLRSVAPIKMGSIQWWLYWLQKLRW